MISFRSTPRPAGAHPVLTALLAACALLVAAPAAALAAPSEPPDLAFEPGAYDFGLQEVNRSNAQAWFQLRNNGPNQAQVFSVDVVGPGANAFWTGFNDCGGRSLSPGEACSVQVTFAPSDAVPFEAQLRASSEEDSTFTADLRGEGGRAVFAPDSDPTNFGTVPVGSPPAVRTIEIANSGNMAAGLFIAVVAGGSVGSFHLLEESCTGVAITPGGSCNLVVSFQPLSVGGKTARIGLFGDGDGGAQVVLTGVGSPPLPAAALGASPAAAAVAPPAVERSAKKRSAKKKKKNRKRRARAKKRRQRLHRSKRHQRAVATARSGRR